MPSFSSVIHKPGQKIVPKAAPRRGLVRRNLPASPALTPESTPAQDQQHEQAQAQHEDPQVPNAAGGTASTTSESHRIEATHPQSTALSPIQQPLVVPPSPADSIATPEPAVALQPDPIQNESRVTTSLPSPSVTVSAPLQIFTPTSALLAQSAPVSEPPQPSSSAQLVVPSSPEQEPSRIVSTSPATQNKRRTTSRTAQTSASPRPGTVISTRPPHTPARAVSEVSQASSIHEDEFNSVTQSLSRISAIARSIDPSAARDQTNGTNTEEQASTQPRKRRKRNPKTVQEQAAEVVANATGEKDLLPRTHRKGTPPDAEDHEIEPSSTLMADLLEDHKWGRKSNVELEMQANWPEILRRRKEEQDNAIEELAKRRAKRAGGNIPPPTAEEMARQRDAAPEVQNVPVQMIVNGQIVITSESREIDRRANLEQVIETSGGNINEDTDIYKRINQSTLGRKNVIPPGEGAWDEASEDLFYQGIRMCGTDFMMVANMIPGKSRHQVKRKFVLEQRNNLARIERAMAERERFTLSEYGNLTGLTFKSADDVYKQMEEDERLLREEDEKRRREEGIIEQGGAAEGNENGEADVAVPSIEQDGEAGDRSVRDDGSTISRLASTAGTRQTTQPASRNVTKKKQNSRAKPNARGKKSKYDSLPSTFTGTDERLGNIDEVSR